MYTASVGGREITGVLSESADDIRGLRQSWKDLLAASSSDSAFLTWNWLYTWSEHFIRGNRRLFVVVLSEGSEIIGIAPWYLDTVVHGPVRVRKIAFLGLPEAGSDYLDVIAKKRKERLVAQALLAMLFGRLSSRWDVLALNEIPANSRFLDHIVAVLRQARKHYVVEEGSFCPGVELPHTFDAYLSQLSSHARQAYKRKMRALLANDCVEHIVLRGEQAVSEGLPAFRQLHEKRWGRPMDGLYELLRHYPTEASGDAWHLESSLLKVQGQPVGGLLHLTRDRTKCQYLMAIDRTFNKSISLGSLICGMNIQCAIDSGFTTYDFLKAGEDYKLQLMNRARRSLNIRVYNKTFGSLSAWTIRTTKDLGKILLR